MKFTLTLLAISISLTACNTVNVKTKANLKSLDKVSASGEPVATWQGQDQLYPDQSFTKYIGEIKWVTGIKDKQGFQKIINTSKAYCKLRITYDDNSDELFNLQPKARTGVIPMSIENQAKSMNTVCNDTSAVFNESV